MPGMTGGRLALAQRDRTQRSFDNRLLRDILFKAARRYGCRTPEQACFSGPLKFEKIGFSPWRQMRESLMTSQGQINN